MAYNPLDVTMASQDFDLFPVWYNKNGHVGEVPDLDFDPGSVANLAAGWVKLGDTSPDGYNFEQSADKKEKKVMSRTLASTYTNFADSVKIQFASSTDRDVLAFLFGDDNVTVLADGALQVAVGARQPATGSFFIATLTDDGRPRRAFAQLAQPDPNMSYSWAEEDITVFEVTLNLFADSRGKTHYETLTPAASV
jgi:hypothetical protein